MYIYLINIYSGKEVKSIHCDVGDTWFVLFTNESDAIATMKLIQSGKIKFNDQNMKARLKSSSITPRASVPSPRGQLPIQG